MGLIKVLLDNLSFTDLSVGGLYGAIITLLLNRIISFFQMKRAKYCISKSLVSSSVYQQTDEAGLKISVSYNGHEVEGPLSLSSIRLRNDGAEDLIYSQRISHLFLCIDSLEVLDVAVSSEIEGVSPVVYRQEDGRFSLKWDLLKRDESFFIKVVVKGELKDISAVRFDIRADGINQIKTPEYRVNEVMIPVFAAFGIVAIPVMLFWPASDMFINVMPMKVFFLICFAFIVLLVWVSALLRRIKWIKEQ